jgi:WD40 repeat protein
MGLLDVFKKSSASDRLPKISKPKLIARIGEEEHPPQQVRNADGGRMVEDWSEGKSGAIWTGRFLGGGKVILSSGKPGFQLWDGQTGALKTTIQMPDFESAGVILESIDISHDYNSFASYGRRPRPGTKFHDYVAWLHRVSALTDPTELPAIKKDEYLFNGIRFLPRPNRVVRSSPRLLELIDTERNQVIDSLTFKSHINMRLSEDGARVFVGWDNGVAVVDCSNDKLSRVADLDLPPSLLHFGIVDNAGKTIFISSRSEGARTGVYAGRISAWDISTKKPLWLIETSTLNTLWRDVTSTALHPNGDTLACCVTEKEVVVGKKHSSASCVLLVNARDGAVREYFKAHRNYAGPVSFTADATQLLTVSAGESAMKLWAL